jgi:hypothetical protein
MFSSCKYLKADSPGESAKSHRDFRQRDEKSGITCPGHGRVNHTDLTVGYIPVICGVI